MSISLLYFLSYFISGNVSLESVERGLLIQRIPQHAIQEQIGAEVEYKNFGVSYIVETYSTLLPDTPYTQSPFQTIYITNFFYRGKSFEAGYEHQCVHPTIGIKQKVSRYGGYDKLYIKGKVTLQGGLK